MKWAGLHQALRLIVLPLAMTIYGCGASYRSGRPAQQQWLELETPHYVVHTDLAEPRAREVVRSLEDTRAALLAGAWPGAKGPPGRTRVVVFAKPADFTRYTGSRGNVAGIAITRPGFERHIAFARGNESGIPRVVTHELVHDLSNWFLPLSPSWLAEGLASYLESARIDIEQGTVVIGEPSPAHADWLKHTKALMSASRLFAATALHSADPRENFAFYSGAWFLVTHLLNEHGQEFGQFQRKLMQLVPWRTAWDEVFPWLTTAALDKSMLDYARTGTFTPVAEAFEPTRFEASLRPLSAAQAHGVRALLGTLLGLDSSSEIDAALQLDPDELGALIASFHSSPSAADDVRQAIARRATTAAPDDAEAWLLAALAAAQRDEQRRALDRAYALAPHHPGVASLLAEDELQRGNPKRALELVRLAERRSGLSPATLAVHVSALLGVRRCDDAARLAEGGASLFGPSCEVHDPTSRRKVGCADMLRATFDAGARSCKTETQAANTVR